MGVQAFSEASERVPDMRLYVRGSKTWRGTYPGEGRYVNDEIDEAIDFRLGCT